MRVEIVDMWLGMQGLRLGHPGRGSKFHLPKTHVLEDLFYDVLVLDDCDDVCLIA
jgi:hypothetical protein